MKSFLVTIVVLSATAGTWYSLTASIHNPPESVPAPIPAMATSSEPILSLKEKVGRLFVIGHWTETPVASTTALIEKHHLGGVIIMNAPEDPTEIATWTERWQSVSDTLLLIAIDQEGGIVTRLKGPNFIQTAQPNISSTDEAYAIGAARAAELAALGINTNFAPVVEASLQPDGFLYDRVFRDPDTITPFAAAMLAGFREHGVYGVIKHFPGHEDEPTDSHFDLPIVELTDTNLDAHTASFRALIKDESIPLIMTAHVLVPSVDPFYPATLSSIIMSEYLRHELGFTGVVITDDMSMDAINERFTTSDAAVLALQAGADLVLFAAEPTEALAAIEAVLQAVEAGTLTEAQINAHLTRINALY